MWRVLRVSSGATLARAQRLICVCFGWPGGRPYAFDAYGVRFESDGRGDLSQVRLRQVLPDLGTELEFEYGTKPQWIIHVKVDRVLAPNGTATTPRCVRGEGISPPFNSGGAFAWNERPEVTVPDDVESHTHPKGRAGGVRIAVPLDLINAELERIR